MFCNRVWSCCKTYVANDEEQRGPQSLAFLDLCPFLVVYPPRRTGVVTGTRSVRLRVWRRSRQAGTRTATRQTPICKCSQLGLCPLPASALPPWLYADLSSTQCSGPMPNIRPSRSVMRPAYLPHGAVPSLPRLASFSASDDELPIPGPIQLWPYIVMAQTTNFQFLALCSYGPI